MILNSTREGFSLMTRETRIPKSARAYGHE